MKFIQVDTTDLVDPGDDTKGYRTIWINVDDIREIHPMSEIRGTRMRAKSKVFFRSGSQGYYANEPHLIIEAICEQERIEIFRRVETEKSAVNKLYPQTP